MCFNNHALKKNNLIHGISVSHMAKLSHATLKIYLRILKGNSPLSMLSLCQEWFAYKKEMGMKSSYIKQGFFVWSPFVVPTLKGLL